MEGHTVFAVIEKVKFQEVEKEAAAVAVLVREREVNERRIKGVLWFNDQYITAPSSGRSQDVRYPCGGAVIAVNAGDPDPRSMLVSYNGTDTYQAFDESNDDAQDVQSYDSDYDQWDSDALEAILGGSDPNGADDVQTMNSPGSSNPAGSPSRAGDQKPTSPTNEPRNNAAGSPNTSPGYPNAVVDHSDPDGVLGTQLGTVSTNAGAFLFDYNTSYLITDPNDHSWIIDKYDAMTVTAIDLDNQADDDSTSVFPVWVVNILGKPVFTPDDGYTSCGPFVDDPWQQGMINSQYTDADGTTCSMTNATATTVCPSNGPGFGRGDADGDGVPADGLDAKPPAIGYYEPTDEDYDGQAGPSYCYDGNPRQGSNQDQASGMGCNHGDSWMPSGAGETMFFGHMDPAGSDRHDGPNPLRIYNALLYFYLDDQNVRVVGSAPHAVGDTNGCEVGTEWTCPGDNDDAEGYSHPFNPPGVYVPRFADPADEEHGGYYQDIHDSTTVGRRCDTGYDDTATDPNGDPVCSPEEHQTHNRGLIDLYFSPTARPMEPPVRFFSEQDTDGRMDPFHENNCPDRDEDGACDPRPAEYHPGQPDYDGYRAP